MSIYSVPANRRYWVIRADGGLYYSHFIENSVIALGHINDAYNYEGVFKPFHPSNSEIDNHFREYFINKGHKKRAASSFLGQIKAFTNELKIGDWVITIGSSETSIGRIVSKPYLNKNALKSRNSESSLSFELRRNVVWGAKFKKHEVPNGLRRSLKSNLTLFSIDRHSEAIYHSLYPYFRIDNTLHLSTKIKTTSKIRNIEITSFLSFLNELEVIAKEGDNITIDHFHDVFDNYSENSLITMTTEAEFHSPGEIWTAITGVMGNLDSWMSYVIGGYAMIFGNTKLGFDGIVDLQTRQKLWEVMIERLKKKNIKEVSKSLKLDIPNTDTTILESEAADEKISPNK